MDIYEHAVLDYICAAPTRFLQVQPCFEWDERLGGGSNPDFLVLDYKVKMGKFRVRRTRAICSTKLWTVNSGG